MGGGAPIIEPSSEDIIIPAFTNVDLTVKGVDLSNCGVTEGEFTRETTSASDVMIDIGMSDYTIFAMYGGDSVNTTNRDIFRIVLFSKRGRLYGAEDYYTSLYYNNWSSIMLENAQPLTGSILKIEEKSTRDAGGAYYPKFLGTYKWIAVK